ncbi:hypothetical protein [Streptomyces sp. NPDC092370]
MNHFGDPRYKMVCAWHKPCDGNPNHPHRWDFVKREEVEKAEK